LGVGAVRRVAERVDARDYTVFGGRLEPGVRGFPAAALAKKMAGDYRNPERVRTWATGISTQLTHQVR
jgi:menaquinone-dependent protoporphyrinogen oxidase